MLWLVALGFGALAGFAVILWIVDAVARRRRYAARVGLDLAGLVALLPAPLQARSYTRFVLAPSPDARIIVGLIYADEARRVGNPANVGLEFEAASGRLLKIHPAGVGLGIK
ncbi:MAG: hypothetical protein H6710_12660 [Myxococcales bacterium]|nr:hypothetical protein [Myxococcales bacterium]MCB9705265.1 hypothetical protein [Myxococcales bacterium]